MGIELHCHSLFSVDGFGAPETLVDIAAERGVTALSLTDHNSVGGTERAAARAAERGIRYFSGIELDAFYRRKSYHFLGLGVDPEHAGLRELAEWNYACYPYRFELFFEELRELGFPWRREELEAYLPVHYPSHPSPVLNTFLVREFVKYKGGLPGYDEMRKEATRRMAPRDRYAQPGPEAVGRFCRFAQARDAVHDAGGVILVAHVGKALPARYDEQIALIRALVYEGADGFELYHPANFDNGDMDRLAALARELDCMVSGGSDCHRVPTSPPEKFGDCGAPEDVVDRLSEALARA